MSNARAKLKIAVAQPLVIPGDIAGNIDRMALLVREASARGARVALFSETGITGYDLEQIGIRAAMTLDHPELKRLADLANNHGVTIIAGLYERTASGTIHNTAIVFHPDGRRVVQRKHNVVAWERDSTPTKPGERERTLFDIEGVRCAILICADSGIENIHAELASQGCDLVLCPTAGCGPAKLGFHLRDIERDEETRKKYLAAAATVCFPGGAIEKAIQLKLAIATSNQLGYDAEKEYFHPGHSMVIDSTGELAALIPGRFCFEHIRPEVAVGTIHAPAR